jgi:hypothetical protein
LDLDKKISIANFSRPLTLQKELLWPDESDAIIVSCIEDMFAA